MCISGSPVRLASLQCGSEAAWVRSRMDTTPPPVLCTLWKHLFGQFYPIEWNWKVTKRHRTRQCDSVQWYWSLENLSKNDSEQCNAQKTNQPSKVIDDASHIKKILGATQVNKNIGFLQMQMWKSEVIIATIKIIMILFRKRFCDVKQMTWVMRGSKKTYCLAQEVIIIIDIVII